MLLNCGVGRKDLRVPWTGRRSNQSILKEMSWIFIGRTAAKAEAPVLWPPDEKSWLISWCWERLKAGGEGDDGGWDGWMASPTQWTWVWVNSRSWWWTGRPGVLQSMGSQRVRHNWATELIEISLWGLLFHHPTSFSYFSSFSFISTYFLVSFVIYSLILLFFRLMFISTYL